MPTRRELQSSTLALSSRRVNSRCQDGGSGSVSISRSVSGAQLRSAITAQTKWLVLNSPNNPTGSGYSADELRALAGTVA